VESIGEYLKRIREEHGLSIGEVARRTRINPGYIEALEENRMEKFPGEVFARGFVRAYGRCLGLDDEDTTTRFAQSSRAFFQKRDESQQHTEQARESQQSRRKVQSRVIQAVVVAAVGLGVLMVYNMNARRSTETGGGSESAPSSVSAPEAPASSEPPLELAGPAVNKPAVKEAGTPQANVPAPPKSPTLPMPPVASQTPAVSKAPASPLPKPPVEKMPLVVNPPGEPAGPPVPALPAGRPAPPVPSAPAASPSPFGDMVLVIEAVESSWVSARIDGGDTKEVFLQPGQKVTWKASDHFLVSFGNAGGVKIQFNGKSLPPFGPKGAVVKDVKISRQ